MRRTIAIVLCALAIAIGGAWLLLSSSSAHPRPQFRKQVRSFTTNRFDHLSYQFLNQRSFEGGKAWLMLIGGRFGRQLADHI